MIYFRWLLIGSQIVTLAITWPLWQVHSETPLLPIFSGFPQFAPGGWLLGSLLVACVRPRLGIGLHSLLMFLSIAQDQTRLQPETISPALLMWSTLPDDNLRLLGRAYLAAMWFFAGFYKATAAGFWQGMPDTIRHVMPWLPDYAAQSLTVATAIGEMGLGIIVFVPRWRRPAAVLACGMHLAIAAFTAIPGVDGWRQPVWAWNIGLAGAGFALFWDWTDAPRAAWQRSASCVRLGIVALLGSPILYGCGRLDAYLAHALYTHPPAASILHADGSCESLLTITTTRLLVSLPPAHRLFEEFYRQTRRPGDQLHIHDPRAWAAWHGYRDRLLMEDGEWRGDANTNTWRRHGWCTVRYKGEPMLAGMYHNGRREGPFTHWDEQGRKQAEGSYRDDEMDGTWILYAPDGAETIAEFRAGKRIGRP